MSKAIAVLALVIGGAATYPWLQKNRDAGDMHGQRKLQLMKVPGSRRKSRTQAASSNGKPPIAARSKATTRPNAIAKRAVRSHAW